MGESKVNYPQLGMRQLGLMLRSSDYLLAIAKILTIKVIQRHNIIALRSLTLSKLIPRSSEDGVKN